MLMKTSPNAILDDLLSRWHHHCERYKFTRGVKAGPMFRAALRAKGGQTLDAITEDQAESAEMKSMDYIILGDRLGQGGMQDPHLSAILICARNCYTGKNVWLSPRLPTEPMERAAVLEQARSMLMRRLMHAGVM